MVTNYTCPNPNPPPLTLTQVLNLLDTDSDFAAFFATTLKLALAGNHEAIDCVDSYFHPTWGELQNLGIPEKDQTAMRNCTDSSLLVLAKCKEKAPQIFP